MRWQDFARCKGMDPDLFFPDRGDNAGYQQAVAVCAECPVRDIGLEEHIGERLGIWGGTSSQDRRTERIYRKSTHGRIFHELRRTA
jgi:WhiB family redox-sensing transcriptional regulator